MPIDVVIENPNGAPPKVGTTKGALNVTLNAEAGGAIDSDSPLATFSANTEKKEGTRTSSHVTDDTAISLLVEILEELKKMNIHLGFITDEKVTNQEIE